ncbi:MAG: zf-HC2 domain-containing protein [Candidatus Solibacter sp.]|nr:zf-HC2 domain-containing protein [Candidatus Solibacter sp.]
MTQCWSEGELRAYLDRELPTEDMQRVAAHLGDCTVCDGLCKELAARAAHVSALLEVLPEWSAAMPRAASRRRQGPNWVGIAVALAACLAVAAYLLPNRAPRKVALVLPAPAPVATTAAALAPAPAEPPQQPAPRRARRVRQSAPEPAYFVALDDEPFESGVIMRVDVKPGNVQADIVFGPDGRAHAFRLVNASQRNF